MSARFLVAALVTVAAIVSVASEGRAVLSPGLTTGVTIQHQALQRTYDIYVPASYTGATPYPLVIDMHGYTLSASAQRTISGLQAIADANAFVVVYPQGYGSPGSSSWNAGTCCGPAVVDGTDDVGLIRAIALAVAAEGNIDNRRIYVTGHSNGSAMAQRLACEAADLFAAAAGVAAPITTNPALQCPATRPVPVQNFAGITDQIVPYAGGPISVYPSAIVPPAVDNFLLWRTVGGCSGGSPNTLESFPSGGSCATYTSCLAGVKVGLCSLHGSDGPGHFLGASYPNVEGVSIPQRIWDFVNQFTLPVACGDGILDGGETCDDANADAGDGCDQTCQVEEGCSCPGQPSVCSCVSLVPGGLVLVRPASLAKFLAKPAAGDTFRLTVSDPMVVGGALRVRDLMGTAGDDTYSLPSGNWKGLGNPIGSKGYKYKGAGTPGDPCKVVLIKEAIIKGVCKGPAITLAPPFTGDVGIVLSVGTTDRYCAQFDDSDEVKNDAILTKRKNAPAPGVCP